ncbi:hypothetical protein K2X14_08615 [Acetobacter sp. TBRC 12305]|uniref:Uncharacterized protein n=1 Tax=Acetobacter garciniae TaxID=2817435 RepID=A0A939KQC0_9PROT|nr:hypothetical protein [Acetobacter garciniae]MBO1325137.1 hypothetical protein [Acetobacter garciniae]MBX0344892.1 hypothetical protein [Acetobacter garciniae]
MALKTQQDTSTDTPTPRTRPTPPDRLKSARGIVIGLFLGLVLWGLLIAGFLLFR